MQYNQFLEKYLLNDYTLCSMLSALQKNKEIKKIINMITNTNQKIYIFLAAPALFVAVVFCKITD